MGCMSMSMSKDMKHGREATLTLGEALAGPGAVHGTWFMVHAVTEDLQASEWIRWTTVTMYLCTVLCRRL